jgi:hypothetical protein
VCSCYETTELRVGASKKPDKCELRDLLRKEDAQVGDGVKRSPQANIDIQDCDCYEGKYTNSSYKLLISTSLAHFEHKMCVCFLARERGRTHHSHSLSYRSFTVTTTLSCLHRRR